MNEQTKKIQPIVALMLLSCGLVSYSLPTWATSIEVKKAQAKFEQQTSSAQKYFRHIMFRETPYAAYRGIHPLKADHNPNVAHYKFNYDQQGRITEISYQINETLIRGNEVWDSYIWFAPKVKIAYSPGKETHSYYNLSGEQIEAHGKVYKAVYQLNEQGQRFALSFYDQEDNPSESAWNVHRYEWRHANGVVFEKRFSLAGEQQTMRPELKFHEVELEYDRHGKLAFMRNLGLEGVPTNNDSGAGIDRITYDQHGNFIRWQVYDKDGNAIEGNRPMVHMGEHLYDQYGNKVGLRGFNRKGERIPFSWGAFEHVQRFDEFGNQTDHQIFKQDGVLDRHLQLEYTEDKAAIQWLKSLDKHGQLAASPMLGGAAAMKYVFAEDGSTQRQFFNADMSRFQPSRKKVSE